MCPCPHHSTSAIADRTQVLLTCIPALTPLFTYFREKSSSRHYYNNSSHPGQINSVPLQSRSRSHAGTWKDALERDSDDNDSTKQIVRDGQKFGQEDGIRATVTVTVESSEARGEEPLGHDVNGFGRENWPRHR